MLSLRNISVSRGGRTVLEGLSAAAERGDLVALRGPNGAGKTTLLHCLAGVLKCDSGEIRCRDGKVDPGGPEWRRRLSYVLDDGGIIPLLTVEEQLYLQGVLCGVGRTEAVERAGLVIDLLELRGYREYRGDELSLGSALSATPKSSFSTSPTAPSMPGRRPFSTGFSGR
jgi:putative ABC transport system ATP-binding protein